MQLSTRLFRAIRCVILGACSVEASIDDVISVQHVRKSLQSRDPARDQQKEGELQFVGDTELLDLSMPNLSKELSGALL